MYQRLFNFRIGGKTQHKMESSDLFFQLQLAQNGVVVVKEILCIRVFILQEQEAAINYNIKIRKCEMILNYPPEFKSIEVDSSNYR